MDLIGKNLFAKNLVLPILAIPLIMMATLTCRADSDMNQEASAQEAAAAEAAEKEASAMAAIERDNMTFLKRLPGLRAEYFKGRAQNFSPFNLDLEMRVHLQAPIEGANNQDWTMNLATNGNNHIHGAVVWPIVGVIKTRIDGQFQIDGQEEVFSPKRKIYYFEETAQSHKARLWRAKKLADTGDLRYQDYANNSGKIYAVITVLTIQELKMRFYESNVENSALISTGVFSAGVTVGQ